MTEHEQYLFDLQGFLVVPNALDEQQLSDLNAILSEHLAVEATEGMQTQRLRSPVKWGPPYRDLIDNPRILPYLKDLLGTSLRLDHDYADVIRSGKGPVGTILHGGSTPYDPTACYHFQNGKMFNGVVAVAYNLRDVNPRDGGFGCVPGSHKSNYYFPMDWLELETPPACVQPVTGPAGTAIIFTEALTHGTLPWRAKHERRTLFYKYSPAAVGYSSYYYNAAEIEGLTARQRDLLKPPNAR
jgi:hypothetical protein